MIRALGGALLLCGCTLCGCGAANRLGKRVELIRDMLAAVRLMRRELSFSLTPTPRLLEELAAQSSGAVHSFFSRCLERLNGLERWSLEEIWTAELQKSDLPAQEEELRVFFRLGTVLGRYDEAGQEACLAGAEEELERLLAAAEEERSRLGRVYRTVGVAAGGFLLVLLL